MSSRWALLSIILLIFGMTLGYVSKCGTNATLSTGAIIDGPFFCPEDHCSSIVIRWISKANSSIDLAMYSFTLDSIGDSLINAHKRRIDVKVILERNQINQWSEYNKLKKNGIKVMIDKNPRYMHNKFMVIDGEVVLTGSYNYTKEADTRNDENLIVIVSRSVARAYDGEFEEMWKGKFGS